MTLTQSTMMPLGTTAPDFILKDVVSGKPVSLKGFTNKPLLIMFICNHCPFVKHVQQQLAQIGQDYREDLHIIAISSNDIQNYPDDSPPSLKKQAQSLRFSFPYLFDQSQKVAQDYTAACTPDLFLFDKSQRLVYRGQLDSSRPGNGQPVTGKDLRGAIDNLLDGKTIKKDQIPSSGCNIKWKSGNEPNYFK